VHLLNTSSRILRDRFGHTELCTALMYLAGVKPSATICEMLGDDGGSRPKGEVLDFAERNGIPFVTGEEVKTAWYEYVDANGLAL